MIKRALRYLPWKKRKDGSLKEHAAPIIDLFASIVMRDEQMSEMDANGALDFLRYSFPEIEHAWLARHFKRATQAIHPVSQVASIAGENKSHTEKLSMALEVLTLLKNARDKRAIEILFPEVISGLELPPETACSLPNLLDTPSFSPDPPIISVAFGSTPEAEVSLPGAEGHLSFRAIRCGDLLIIINDAELPLRVRGKSLPPRSATLLTTGQSISLHSGTITYSDILFILNSKKTGRKIPLYLYLENGSLILQRTRLRSSILRIGFGLSPEVELLRDRQVFLDGERLTPGAPVSATYHSILDVEHVGVFILSHLQNRTQNIGSRFEIDPGHQTIMVSNDPTRIGPGDLLIGRGMMGRVLFEVRFSRTTGEGLLTPIETLEPLTVNGKTVKGITQLKDGDIIRINLNQSIRCNFESGILDEERNVINELQVNSLGHEFTKGTKVLDNIDFTVSRGEMVCILGPSGSGKSTLLTCLSGHMEPTRGKIRYNGLSLYSSRQRIRPLIAHIPREDILNPYQTVREHLSQALTIRRPKLNSFDKRRRVYSLMKYLGLGHLANRKVGASSDKHLSDGERTRLNLGLDMAGIADVFLIDEPISGLSSRDSENIIDTLENISREKIVITTLHRPSARLLNRFHKVLILDHSGQLAFWGTPAHMLRYFSDAARELGIAVSLDNKSVGGADFVFEVLDAPFAHHEKGEFHPGLWQQRFEDYRFKISKGGDIPTLTRTESHDAIPNISRKGILERWRIFHVWFMRTLVSRTRSRTNLYTALIEGPILAFLIAFFLRSAVEGEYTFSKALHINSYLFLSTVAAMFFGLMASSSEFIRDRCLLNRESNTQIFFSGYMGAKALVLTIVTTVQCALYLLVGNAILEIHDLFLPFLAVMVLTSFVGMSLSLLISLIVKTERASLNVIPLLLVPQILMAGAVIPFNEMNKLVSVPPRYDESGNLRPGLVPYVSDLCPLRYSYEGMMVLQATRNPYDYNRKIIQQKVNKLKDKDTRLTPNENNQLKLALQTLTFISALEAVDAHEADYALRRIREAVMRNDAPFLPEFLERFELLNEEKSLGTEKHTRPLADYFVNERLGSQFDYAEALRLNRELDDRPVIFLAANQPLPLTSNNTDRDDPSFTADKNTIPTPLYDILHLLSMGLLLLILSRYLLKRKMERI